MVKRLVCIVIGHRWSVYAWARWEKYAGRLTGGKECERCGHRTVEVPP